MAYLTIPRQVEMWVHPLRPIVGLLPGVDIATGQGILVEISRKFIPEDIQALGSCTNLACKVGLFGGRVEALSLNLRQDPYLRSI